MSEPASDSEAAQPVGNRKPQNNNALQLQQQNNALQQQLQALQEQSNKQPNVAGGRIAPVRQSRILDRPPKQGEKDSSLKIKIELDLEVEVDLYARVKGDVMIGLM